MNNQNRFPWDQLMQLGLGELGLSSHEFWAMTPRELNAAALGRMGRPASSSPLARRDFISLMEQYPDDHPR